MRTTRVHQLVLAALCIALTVIGVGIWAARGSTTKAYDTTVTVNASGRALGEISNQYIGLSFESDTLNSGKFANVGDLPVLLRNIGDSDLRFGGNSVDTSFTGITPGALAGLASLAKASGWTVLYSENLGKFDAARVTADAKAVQAALGGSLFAFACGNEPDVFSGNGIRPQSYGERDYLRQAAACYAAIHAGAPSAPLEGPDTAAAPKWLAEYALKEAGIVSVLGQHYYPLGCEWRGKSPSELADMLLSPNLASQEIKTFDSASGDAKTAASQLRITETNSACNGGVPGVSDSYVAALWVIDYLLTGAEHGVDGMNFHGGLSTSCEGYTPLCQVEPNEYAAQPIYYGMLFTHLMGTGQLLPVTVSTSSSPGQVSAPDRNVAAFAVRPLIGGGLRLILENLSQFQTDVTLDVAGHSNTATVLHLTAPSLLATSGVQIQGATVAGNGAFEPGHPDSVQCTSRSCPLTIAPYTAVLVSTGLPAGRFMPRLPRHRFATVPFVGLSAMRRANLHPATQQYGCPDRHPPLSCC